ncbi:MAG: EF-hand domain-containing protein [Methylophilaceae bacterium]
MLIAKNLFSHHKHACLALCILLAFSGHLSAAPRDNQSNADESANKGVDSDAQEPVSPKKLGGPISIEESIRLRRDLDEYSRTVDPAHVQIEERRRLMHQRIQSRFAETDKDNDGTISMEEAAESLPQVARHFNAVDLNGDGLVSLDELEALQAKIVERQRASAIRMEVQEPEPSKRKSKDAMLSNRKRTL